MKYVILTFIIIFGAFNVSAQSTDIESYQPLFAYDQTIHYIDTNSIQFLKGNRVVFWSAVPTKESLVLTSVEVNCTLRRARIRAIIAANSFQTIKRKVVTNWFPKTDVLANLYVQNACQ